MNEYVMSMWVIYAKPKDFPDRFVVRQWKLFRGESGPVPCSDHQLADTLDDARAKLPAGLVRINRYGDDDPSIVETWL